MATIQLKIKSKPSSDPQLEPYINKVLEKLKGTDVRKDLVESIELAIRQKTIEDMKNLFLDNNFELVKNAYLTDARHIISNLTANNNIKNLQLIDKVNNNLITPFDLVRLTPQEMYTEVWQKCMEKKLSDIIKLTQDPEATTELFHCSRCGRNKCTYFERQDRSSDECMTIHITCCHCGKRWRQ